MSASMIIVPINKPEWDHLREVMDEMRQLGAPIIKAVRDDSLVADAMNEEGWVALEGSHRLAAAKELGMTPIIEEVEYDETTTLEDLGCDDSGEGCTVADIFDSAWERASRNMAMRFATEE